MRKTSSTTASKESRLSIRVDPQRKAVIARAAKRHGRTISDFVLENAYQMATELLADEGTIALSKKQVAHIFEMLDHPPAKSVAAVRKLLPRGLQPASHACGASRSRPIAVTSSSSMPCAAK